MRTSLLALLVGLGAIGPSIAQAPLSVPAAPSYVPDSYIVRFAERSFDLEDFRLAIRSGKSATEVAEIVGRMEAAVTRDQADFVREVERLGGRVSHQWWIINAAAVGGITGDGIERLGKLPNVDVVERDWLQYPSNNVARDSQHHEADRANTRTDSTGQPVLGTGVPVTLLCSYRGDVGETEHWGIPHGIVAEPLLDALRVKYLVVRRVEELRTAIVRAHRLSEAQLHPAAVLVSGDCVWDDGGDR